MNSTRPLRTNLTVAAALALLVSVVQPAHAYVLRGAICKKGGSPSISLENQDNKFIIELATGAGGKSQVGLLIKGLDTNPIVVKDLDKTQITAVFEIKDKRVLQYSRTLQFKVSVKNADGKIIVPTIPCDTDTSRPGKIPMVRVNGNTYSATLPSKVIIDLGKEVARLKISENSPVVGCTIYLDGDNFGFDEKNKSVLVDSISVGGNKLGVQDLGSFLGCEAFPSSVFTP